MVRFDYQKSGVPLWFTRAMDALTRALNSGPLLLGSITSTDINTVYDAGSYLGSQVFVSDINRVAVSNGSNWIRTDTGAVI